MMAHFRLGPTPPVGSEYTRIYPMRMDDMTIKVAIVDDQQLIRSGLSMLINSRDDLRVTGEASDGQQAVNSAHIRSADVVLMDVRMPIMDGIAATKGLLEHNPKIHIIVL